MSQKFDIDENMYQATEFMDADDMMYFDHQLSNYKMEKTDVLAEKLLDKDFYNDFGDIFDPDATTSA